MFRAELVPQFLHIQCCLLRGVLWGWPLQPETVENFRCFPGWWHIRTDSTDLFNNRVNNRDVEELQVSEFSCKKLWFIPPYRMMSVKGPAYVTLLDVFFHTLVSLVSWAPQGQCRLERLLDCGLHCSWEDDRLAACWTDGCGCPYWYRN